MTMGFSTKAVALGMGLSLLSLSIHAESLLDETDRALPVFELASLDNDQWQASDLAGKPWVINFWATWCPPCIEEIPSMNNAWEAIESQGVGMLAINAGEGEEAVNSFMDRVTIDFPVLLGGADVLPVWSIKVLPTTLVVDANGRVVYEAVGPREWDDAELLNAVLALRD